MLKKEEFLSIPVFEDGLKRFDDLLENFEINYDRDEYKKAYDVLCKLCSLLFTNRKLDVVRDLITIELRLKYMLWLSSDKSP